MIDKGIGLAIGAIVLIICLLFLVNGIISKQKIRLCGGLVGILVSAFIILWFALTMRMEYDCRAHSDNSNNSNNIYDNSTETTEFKAPYRGDMYSEIEEQVYVGRSL